jgi:hypothetical protein
MPTRAVALLVVHGFTSKEPYAIGIAKGTAFCQFIDDALKSADTEGTYSAAWKATVGSVQPEYRRHRQLQLTSPTPAAAPMWADPRLLVDQALRCWDYVLPVDRPATALSAAARIPGDRADGLHAAVVGRSGRLRHARPRTSPVEA